MPTPGWIAEKAAHYYHKDSQAEVNQMHSSYFVLKSREGKQAEQIVKDYLTDRGYTVQDVSEEWDNYQNDVDFIVQKDGRTSKIEVKLDTRLAETQNHSL